MKTKKRFLSILLSLALVLVLVPGMSLTAFAATQTWGGNVTKEGSINGGVDVTADITLTIESGKTLTITGGINATGHTLTVAGEGTLIVKGSNGSNGSNDNGGNGGNGGNGIVGNVIVSGASVEVTGGNGGAGGDGDNGGTGGTGGYGVNGAVTVKSGSIKVTGGSGGKGGNGNPSGTSGNGGEGGCGVSGDVTVKSGSITVTGGSGGGKGGGPGGGTNGNAGQAVSGTITGATAQESDNNSNWSDITSGTSSKKYVKVEGAAATSYTVTYKVVGGTWSDGSSADKTETVQDGSQPASVPTGMKASEGYTGGAWNTDPANATIRAAKTFTYTFTAKSDQTAPTGLTATKASSSTATDGKISGVTSAMEYQADGASTWTSVGENKTEITGLTSGTYKVRYAGTADKNASPETTIVVGTKTNQTAPAGLTATKASSSTATDGKISGVTSAMEYQIDGASTWTAVGENKTEITGLTAGTYKVRYAETADKNASPETSVEVGVKVAPTVTAPTAKTLTYNGQAQELVTAGSTDGGEMQYALGTATEATEQYTTSIPTKTDAGTYYIWYKVLGDSNHTGTAPECLTVVIKKANPSYNIPGNLTATFGQKLSQISLLAGWTWDDPQADVGNVGENHHPAAYTPEDTDNYNTVSENLIVTVVRVDREGLISTVSQASAYYDKIKDKEEYSEVAKDLSDSISAANDVVENDSALEADIQTALAALIDALNDAGNKVKEIDDTAAAGKVLDLLKPVPEKDKVVISDAESIEAARAAYGALTDDQRALIPEELVKKLTDAEEALEAIRTDIKAAEEAEKKINVLPAANAIKVSDKAAIEAARAAYDALTADQKALIPSDVLKKLTDAEQALTDAGNKPADLPSDAEAEEQTEISNQKRDEMVDLLNSKGTNEVKGIYQTGYDTVSADYVITNGKITAMSINEDSIKEGKNYLTINTGVRLVLGKTYTISGNYVDAKEAKKISKFVKTKKGECVFEPKRLKSHKGGSYQVTLTSGKTELIVDVIDVSLNKKAIKTITLTDAVSQSAVSANAVVVDKIGLEGSSVSGNVVTIATSPAFKAEIPSMKDKSARFISGIWQVGDTYVSRGEIKTVTKGKVSVIVKANSDGTLSIGKAEGSGKGSLNINYVLNGKVKKTKRGTKIKSMVYKAKIKVQ